MSQTPQISTEHGEDINRVIDYWFTPYSPDAPVTQKWFSGPNRDEIDQEIRSNFETSIQQARNHTLDSWTSTPQGSLALIILLDQFPRNIFRGSHLSYSSDAKAVEVALSSIAKDFDRSESISELQTLFFYMPLMHAESLVHQIAGIALFDNLITRCLASKKLNESDREQVSAWVKRSCGFAKGHRDVIIRFGRFPSRNEVLRRESTEEERTFLRENPSGFLPGGHGNG